MILEQQTDLTLSLVINLYDSGFSFDDQACTRIAVDNDILHM
jgi:hypothetical protein